MTGRVLTSDEDKICLFCGTMRGIEMHHVYSGAYRKKSTAHGYIVPLCRDCHTGPHGVHADKDKRNYIKGFYQRIYEETHSREEFISEFGRNYLED